MMPAQRLIAPEGSMSAYKTLEHHEHAEHIAHSGHGESGGHDAAKARRAQMAALLVATLAAGLAISEQGAKHAEIRTQLNMINATDAWAQYQAKSTRATFTQDIVRMIGVMEPPTSAEIGERRQKAVEAMKQEQERFERDPKDGKEAISHRAHAFEHERDHALEQTHAYHNGSAMMELGIVLATASAIIGSRLLIVMAATIGVFGGLCAVAGYYAPEWGSF
jgi:hypothetical protein